MLRKGKKHEWHELFCKGLGGVKKKRETLEKEKREKELEALKKEGGAVEKEDAALAKPVPKVSDGKQVREGEGGAERTRPSEARMRRRRCILRRRI